MDVFTVRFVRNDFRPNEEYSYYVKEDAEHHFSLFHNDDSGLYREIVLLRTAGDKETILDRIQFS